MLTLSLRGLNAETAVAVAVRQHLWLLSKLYHGNMIMGIHCSAWWMKNEFLPPNRLLLLYLFSIRLWMVEVSAACSYNHLCLLLVIGSVTVILDGLRSVASFLRL